MEPGRHSRACSIWKALDRVLSESARCDSDPDGTPHGPAPARVPVFPEKYDERPLIFRDSALTSLPRPSFGPSVHHLGCSIQGEVSGHRKTDTDAAANQAMDPTHRIRVSPPGQTIHPGGPDRGPGPFPRCLHVMVVSKATTMRQQGSGHYGRLAAGQQHPSRLRADEPPLRLGGPHAPSPARRPAQMMDPRGTGHATTPRRCGSTHTHRNTNIRGDTHTHIR